MRVVLKLKQWLGLAPKPWEAQALIQQQAILARQQALLDLMSLLAESDGLVLEAVVELRRCIATWLDSEPDWPPMPSSEPPEDWTEHPLVAMLQSAVDRNPSLAREKILPWRVTEVEH